MKLDARQVAGFLRSPGGMRAALLHGEDEGLLRERAQALTRQIAGSLNDPFLVVELTREGWARIPAEMAALSMIGGRRVIVVRDAADAVLGYVQEALKGPGEAMLVLEAAGLGRGRLRSFAEGSADTACIACYAEEGAALTGLIAGLFATQRVRADPDAVAWLSQVIGGDRAVIRGEVEKLCLFAGEGGRVDIDLARQCVGEAASSAGDDGIFTATLGDLPASDTAIEAALADGLNGVALLRMAIGHLQKLHQARLRMQDGQSAADAVRAMRPPVFYKMVAPMTTVLTLWTADSLQKAIEEARRAELACKQTGSRPELLARRFVQTVARAAQGRKTRA